MQKYIVPISTVLKENDNKLINDKMNAYNIDLGFFFLTLTDTSHTTVALKSQSPNLPLPLL